MTINAGALNEIISVMELRESATGWAWTTRREAWAAVEQTESRRIFSSSGTAAGSTIAFTVRRQDLSMSDAVEWQGQHCFITSVVPTKDRAHLIVTTAPVVCITATCRSTGKSFPCVLAEKYVGYERENAFSEITTRYVLVLPKPVRLTPGDLVTLPGFGVFNVQVPHELDYHRNEYEAERRGDV